MRGLVWLLNIFGFFSLIGQSGCGALHKTLLDREMRIQGVFLCPPVEVSRPLNESRDAEVVRCYQDSITVSYESLAWSRKLFSDSNCAANAIGDAEWKTPIRSYVRENSEVTLVRLGSKERPRFTRFSYNWFMDPKYGCDLRKVPVGKPQYAGTEPNCSGLFREEAQEGHVRFSNEGRQSARELKLGQAAGPLCER